LEPTPLRPLLAAWVSANARRFTGWLLFCQEGRHFAGRGLDKSIAGFGGNDDRDLGLRLIGLGLPLHFDPKALGYHYQGLLRDQRHGSLANQYLMVKCRDLF
jgi:hypothetical protein